MTYERWQEQWDALKAICTAAMMPGGQLAGVANIELSTPPESQSFAEGAQLGIMFDHYDAGDFVAQYTQDVRATFILCIAIREPYSPTSPDTRARAFATLRNFVNDGHGNGLSPLLRANIQLQNTCLSSYIKSVQFVPYEGKAQTAGMVASAWYTLVTKDRVRLL